MALRYDERNAHAQCIDCNRFKRGSKLVEDAYANRLRLMYGEGFVESLKKERFANPRMFSASELNDIAKEFRRRARIIRKTI